MRDLIERAHEVLVQTEASVEEMIHGAENRILAMNEATAAEVRADLTQALTETRNNVRELHKQFRVALDINLPMETNTHRRVRVTLKALIGRINRNLAKKGEQLFIARRPSQDTGDYYVVDREGGGGIVHANVDPEALGRELGVLRSWEEVEWPSAEARN